MLLAPSLLWDSHYMLHLYTLKKLIILWFSCIKILHSFKNNIKLSSIFIDMFSSQYYIVLSGFPISTWYNFLQSAIFFVDLKIFLLSPYYQTRISKNYRLFGMVLPEYLEMEKASDRIAFEWSISILVSGLSIFRSLKL